MKAIQSEIDFSQPGKHLGYLRLPHSVHRSAYGWIPIPVASIKNGSGPKILVMAGNHGDEYEGQIIVSRLIRELDAAQVQGQLILLPMANYPAAAAGQRVSPIDQANMNRCFPGDLAGTPTHVIAHYIEHNLMPGCQYVLDLHSGGSSLTYYGGCLLVRDPGDATGRAHIRTLMEHLHVVHGCLLEQDLSTTSAGAAKRQGAVQFTAELAGAGVVSPDVLHRAWNGVLHFLGQVGAVDPALSTPIKDHQMRFLRIEARHHVYAYDAGVFEPIAPLGTQVRAGDLVARLHHPDTPGRASTEVHTSADGLVLCKRVPALAQRGDCLYQLAEAV